MECNIDNTNELDYVPFYKKKESCVYMLTFPNKKVYIGQTTNPIYRWNNGNGYKYNTEMYNDILYYGWKNITKTILYKDLTRGEARRKEKELIVLYKSNQAPFGYNRQGGVDK